jgi:hypothetical protein
VVFESVAATTQAVIGTIATTIDNADTGAALVYDGSNENVRFVIANGSGVDFVMDKTTATSSVPANQVTIVTVRVDFSVTPNAEAEIRIWSSGDLTEYIEEIGTATSETPSSSAVGTFLVGASGEGALDGSFLEGTVLDRVVTDNELLDLVRYLTRWM